MSTTPMPDSRPTDYLRLLAAHALADDYYNRELGMGGSDALADAADLTRIALMDLTPPVGVEASPDAKRALQHLRVIREALLELGHSAYGHVIPDGKTRRAERDEARAQRDARRGFGRQAPHDDRGIGGRDINTHKGH